MDPQISEFLLRFFIGGVVVSLFSLLGDALTPKSFAGLFGAAPSVALATLGLAIAKHGGEYASIEGRSMIVGAMGLLLYSQLIAALTMDAKAKPLPTAVGALAVWFIAAFGLWACVLK